MLALPAPAADAPNFEDHVKPILRANCAGCHNPGKASGGLDLSGYNALLRGGASGDVVAAGDADSSALFLAISHQRQPFMPPNAAKRPDAELESIRAWIAGGLLERKGGAAQVASKSKVDLRVTGSAMKRPEGPPPMPAGLPLRAVARVERPGPVVAAAASPWAPLVALGGAEQVALYRTDTLDPVGVLPFPEGEPQTLKFSRNGRLLLCGGGVGAKAGRVVAWDIVTGARVIEVGDEFDVVLAADVSPDHTAVALGGPGRLVRVYAADDGRVLHEIKKHTDWVTAIEYSPDGVLLATGDRGGGLVLWEAQSGQEFSVLQGHQGAITDLSWRKDAEVLASAGEDGFIRLWNPHDGKPVKAWKAHDGGALSVEYAQDGRLVSCGRDKTARIWDGGGKQERAIEGFADVPLSAVFTEDAGRVIVGDWAGGVAVVDAASGARAGSLRANPPGLAEYIEETTRGIASLREQAAGIEGRAAQARSAAQNQGASLDTLKGRAAEAAKKLKDAESAADPICKAAESAAAELEKIKAAFAARGNDLAATETRRKGEQERLSQSATAHKAMEVALAEQKKTAEESAAAFTKAKESAAANAADAAAAEAAAKVEKDAQAAAAEADRLAKALADSRANLDRIAAAAKAADDERKKASADVDSLRRCVDEKSKVAEAAGAKRAEAKKARAAAASANEQADKAVAAASPKADAARQQAGELAQALEKTHRDIVSAEAALLRARAAQLDELLRAAAQRVAPGHPEAPPLAELVRAASLAVEKLRPSDLRAETNAAPAQEAAGGEAAAGSESAMARPAWFFLGRFHLVLLHVPIGVLLAAFLLELDGLWRRTEWSRRVAGQLLLFGAATAALTAVLGLLLALEPGYDAATLRTHKWFGIAAAACAIAAALTRGLDSRRGRAAHWGAFGATMLCLAMAGHAGGELSHGRGFLQRYFANWIISATGRDAPGPDAAQGGEFHSVVRPILEAHCIECHGPAQQSSGYRLDQKGPAFAGGKSAAPAIVPGRAAESELVRRLLLARDDTAAMPPSTKPQLRDEELMRLVRWINGGAEWPDTAPPPAAAEQTPALPAEKPLAAQEQARK